MKKIFHLLLLVALLSNIFIPQVFAQSATQQSFVVNKIVFVGLDHIKPLAAQGYLPIKPGQTLHPNQTSNILRALYKTGYFDHISLSREGHTLVIYVTERPTIGELTIKGNSVIPKDKLLSVMKSLGIAEGYIYNAAMLEKIKQSLLNQYYQLGRYNATIDITVTPMPRNQVSVKIVISEGLVAKIRRISIIGNHVFSEKTLINQLDISTVGLFTFLTQTDRYSEERLDTSLDKLRNYYLDHGYLHFKVLSYQAQVTPDRKSVYVDIVVTEGLPYTLSSYSVEGNTIIPDAELKKLINLHPGETFSRQKVVDAEKAITNYLGNRGYMYANVSLNPTIDEANRTISIVFIIEPRQRVYVRHITFSGNNKTNDKVLRREVQQMEGAPVSTTELDNSKHNLSMLPYLKNVDMSVKPVPGSSDLTDVNYKVDEQSAASATFKVGYEQEQGWLLGAGLNQNNFLGTGNTFGLNFSVSKYMQYYGISYLDPYYTDDGISRSINLAVTKTDPNVLAGDIGYTTHEYDAGILYSIPIGQEENVYNRIQAGVSYENILVHLIRGTLSNQILDFVARHGTHFQFLDFRLGYSRDSRDKAIMPTSGSLQTAFADIYAPLSSGSVSFYTLNYSGNWYWPLSDEFIIHSRAGLGYGNGFHGPHDFPFFKNFFAGGIDSVRGYVENSLSPLDSRGQPFGGNELIDGSLSLIFPNYISDNLRTALFVDGGNVYTTIDNRSYGGQSTDGGPIRFSLGLEADWIVMPFGPIELSLAKTLNHRHGTSTHPGDQIKGFQFAVGANF